MTANDAVSGFVELPDNVRLRYNQYGPPSAPNLVLIPGWAQTAAEFRKQVEHFRRRFRVTTYDHRGHGESDKPAFGYRVTRLAADLDALLAQLDLRDAALLGHSMGCSAIWAHWDLFPHARVAKLVFVDQAPVMLANPTWPADEAAGYAALFTPAGVWDLANGLARPGGEGEAALARLAGGFFTPRADPADVEWVLGQNRKMPLPLAAALLLDHAHMDWRDVIPRIDVPTLVIGAEGSLFSTRGLRWVAEQIPGAKLRIFGEEEGGSHCMFWENPEEFNRVVEEFLTG